MNDVIHYAADAPPSSYLVPVMMMMVVDYEEYTYYNYTCAVSF